MAKNYKLNEEIKQFIIQQKKANPALSCRGLTSLIKEKFQVELSKSLINNVLKESSLSSPVGRKSAKQPIKEPEKEPIKEPIKESIIAQKPAEAQISRQEVEFMENGGFFFLKAADLRLGLISNLTEIFSAYFPGSSKQEHQASIEALIYNPFFKDKKSLWLLIGKEVAQVSLTQYSQHLNNIPLLGLKESMAKLGIEHNSSEVNELWSKCLLRLNSYIVHSFPPEYQFLDFPDMRERFYCLPGKVERKPGLLIIQLFYPTRFYWLNDIIWQEGFSYAANKVNEAKFFTPDNEQIWISPQAQFL